MRYYIADCHFFHEALNREMDHRGFASVEEMNEYMIKRWNEKVRNRDEVVIFDEYGPVRMIRTKEWKYVHRYPYGKHELYHLVDDPGEEKNLYGLPEYKKLVTQLKGRMEKWFCTYSDPAIDGVRSAVNGSGQLCRPGVYAIYEDPFAPKGVE